MRKLNSTDLVRVASNPGSAPGMGGAVELGHLLGGAVHGFSGHPLVTVKNQGPPRIDLLEFEDLPITVTSVTTGNGVGGTKIFQFPPGYIQHFFTRGELSVRIDEDHQSDFTDATPEGDLGVGTVAPANADALGTDSTDDNFGTATAFTMANYVDSSVVIPTEAAAAYDGISSPIALYLNALVDAADIDDGVETEILVSGWLLVCWALQTRLA